MPFPYNQTFFFFLCWWLILGHCSPSVAGQDYCKMENCIASFPFHRLLSSHSSFRGFVLFCNNSVHLPAHYCVKCGWILLNLMKMKGYIYLLMLKSDSQICHWRAILSLVSDWKGFYQASSLTMQFSLWGCVSLSEIEAWGWRLHGVRGWRREGR